MVQVPTKSPRVAAVNGKKQVSIRQLLEWAFQREFAQVDFDSVDRFGSVAQASFGMEYLLLERARVGCSIDGGGRSDPHHDAELVSAALSVLPVARGGRGMAVQIAELARVGAVPDCKLDARPRVEPAVWKDHWRGRFAKKEWLRDLQFSYRGRQRVFESYWCPIRYYDGSAEVAAARRNYLDWWAALDELRYTFQARRDLIAYEVTDAMPPMMPWKNTS